MFALKLAVAAVVNEVRLLMAPSNWEFAVCIVTAGNGEPVPANVLWNFINCPSFAVKIASL